MCNVAGQRFRCTVKGAAVEALEMAQHIERVTKLRPEIHAGREAIVQESPQRVPVALAERITNFSHVATRAVHFACEFLLHEHRRPNRNTRTNNARANRNVRRLASRCKGGGSEPGGVAGHLGMAHAAALGLNRGAKAGNRRENESRRPNHTAITHLKTGKATGLREGSVKGGLLDHLTGQGHRARAGGERTKGESPPGIPPRAPALPPW